MVVQNVIFLAQDNCRTLCRNTLDVKRVGISEVVLDLIQHLKDFACKSDAFISVADVPELIRLGVTKRLNDFIQTKDAHCAVLLVHLDRAILIVGEQPFFNVSLDNMADSKKFQSEVDNDWYYLLTDKDEDEYVTALAKFAEASEPSEAELGAGVEDHRKFYMGQTSNKAFVCNTARAAVIYADADNLNEEPDASYTGNVGPFYPTSVTWKFKRPQDGNASTTKLITLPLLTDGEREALLENHVNFLTEEYKRQYVKDGTCLNGEFIDVVLGGDWIAKRMRDLLYDILLENANINYGDDGFGMIGTAVLQALAEATDLNIIARDPESKTGVFTVVIPKYAESTEDQRRNRVMPDITWEAQLAGAVHQVKTKGVLRATL